MTTSSSSPDSTARDAVPTTSRYECLVKVASGGMATVYVGRLRGKHGFSRLVAIKRAHAHLLDDDQLRRGLIGEARIAAQIHDPHVVSVLDVDEPGGELMLVMDYIEGGSLSQLLTNAGKRGEKLPAGVVVRILLDACAGLSAAHELRSDSGQPLFIVHRDVSPHNILVGVDGLSRIADFGIAKWSEATHATSAGLKGKFSYMAPEYIKTRKLDQRADVFGLGVVAWEAFTGQRLFRGDGELETIEQVLSLEPAPVSSAAPAVPALFDPIVARALEKDPSKRFESARELGRALASAAESAGLDTGVAPVGETVRHLLGDVLEARRTVLRDLNAGGSLSTRGSPPASSKSTSDRTEGIPTATATLDAAFATDARTLPIERPKPGAVAEARGDASPTTKSKISARASISIVAATTVVIGAIAFVWSGRVAGPSLPATPAASPVDTAGSSSATEAPRAGSTAPSAEAHALSAEATTSAQPSSAPARKPPPRHVEANAVASPASPSVARPAATVTAPSRPGLGY